MTRSNTANVGSNKSREAEGNCNEDIEGNCRCGGEVERTDGDCCGGEVERTDRTIIIQRNNQATTSRYHFGKLGLSFSIPTSMLGSLRSIPRSMQDTGGFESTSFLPGICQEAIVNDKCPYNDTERRQEKRGYLCLLCCGHKQKEIAAEDKEGTMMETLSSCLWILNHS